MRPECGKLPENHKSDGRLRAHSQSPQFNFKQNLSVMSEQIFVFFMNSNSHNRCMPQAHALIRHKRLLKSAGPTMANYALWAPHGGVDVKNTLFF